jgi:3-oxosteroid 1-dehydrogenase
MTAPPTAGGAPVTRRPDLSADVVVVGSGAAGLAAAVSAATSGSSVILLEKSVELGGTTRKSGGVFWIPGNHHQRARGLPDDRATALRYMARVADPERYQPDDELLGLTRWEHDSLSAYVEHAPATIVALECLGALTATVEAGQHFPDYHCELPEQGGIRGRALAPTAPDGTPGGGRDLVDQLVRATERVGVHTLTDVAFRDLVVDRGRVVGVVASSADRELHLEAGGGVVLATGGFTHDAQRRAQLPGRVWGGCAVGENTGDILPALESLGIPLHNMDCAWWDQVAVEHTLTGTTETRAGVWVAPGDSSVIVDLDGRRVVNEKAVYNSRAKVHHGQGAPEVLLLLMDQRCLDLFDEESFAYPIATSDLLSPDHLVSAPTWELLADALADRLALHRDRIGARLGAGFLTGLNQTLKEYDAAAAAGDDPEFLRGTHPIELFFHGRARPGAGPNPTMAPFSDTGPYHAVLIGLGTLDTKGGPRTDPAGRVLDRDGDAVPGLYAAGNAAASPSGQGYWAAGATIGPALVFGYAAGRHAAERSRAARTPQIARLDLPSS